MKGGVWVSGGSGGSWRSLGHRAQGQQSTSAERPEGKLGQRQVCGEESADRGLERRQLRKMAEYR